MNTETTQLPKAYYDDPTLNRIANERKWDRIFSEKTMLEIMAEHCDEREFIKEIESQL